MLTLVPRRLNHSCIPNAQQTHIPSTTEEVLYACRDIAIGDEINDCYIELRRSRDDRRKELQQLFRFDCECLNCCLDAAEGAADDKKRCRALKLEEFIYQAVEMNPMTALDIVKEVLTP